jgi:two-component system cell cycle response regulator CtrA
VRILLIEDDITIAQTIETKIASEGGVLDLSMLGEEGLEFSKMYKYDLIILDTSLPDATGYDILKELRSLQIDFPVLVISKSSSVEDKVKALSLGADDYLQKPFNILELIARVKAIIRRSKGNSNAIFRVGNLYIDFNSHSTYIDDILIHLTAKEQVLIEALAMRKGNVVSKESLLGQLYNPVDEPELKIIDVFVCKMRKKLYEASGGMNYIETVWGRGYALKEVVKESNIADERMVAND